MGEKRLAIEYANNLWKYYDNFTKYELTSVNTSRYKDIFWKDDKYTIPKILQPYCVEVLYAEKDTKCVTFELVNYGEKNYLNLDPELKNLINVALLDKYSPTALILDKNKKIIGTLQGSHYYGYCYFLTVGKLMYEYPFLAFVYCPFDSNDKEEDNCRDLYIFLEIPSKIFTTDYIHKGGNNNEYLQKFNKKVFYKDTFEHAMFADYLRILKKHGHSLFCFYVIEYFPKKTKKFEFALIAKKWSPPFTFAVDGVVFGIANTLINNY